MIRQSRRSLLKRRLCPTGSPFGKYRFTTDCEITATGAESAVSASEIERPLTIGVRRVSKYPGITIRTEAVGSCPGSTGCPEGTKREGAKGATGGGKLIAL